MKASRVPKLLRAGSLSGSVGLGLGVLLDSVVAGSVGFCLACMPRVCNSFLGSGDVGWV